MSMIYGIFSRGRHEVPAEWHSRMAHRASIWPADHAADYCSEVGKVTIRERSRYAGAPANGFARNDNFVVAIDGHIHNRAELFSCLNLKAATDAELVLEAFKKWGNSFASYLVGEFACILQRIDGQSVTFARDAMGIRPLFIANSSDFVAFASSMDVLLDLPFIDRSPDFNWLVDYLEQIKADDPSTPYGGIKIVPPAVTVCATRHTTESATHWSPPPLSEAYDLSAEEAVDEYRRLFDQAIESRLPEKGIAACELSGGLDSTSIAVTAAPMMAQRSATLVTLSHIMDTTSSAGLHLVDECQEIADVLKNMPAGLHHWLDDCPPSQLKLLADSVARHGGPQRRDFSAMQPRVAAIMRENDCRVLLSGHGGDQCATSNGAGFIESLAQAGDWEKLSEVARSKPRLLWRSKFGRELLQRRAKRSLRNSARNAPRLTRPLHLSDGALVERRISFPLRPIWGTIGERERLVITSPHIAQRTQDSAVGTGPDGFSHTYPMLDRRLVEFCLRVPDLLKRTPAIRRVLIRFAMVGRLPDSVRLRDDKSGAILPVAVSGFYSELDAYTDLLSSCKDNTLLNNLIDPEGIESTLKELVCGERGNSALRPQYVRRLAQICLWSSDPRLPPVV